MKKEIGQWSFHKQFQTQISFSRQTYLIQDLKICKYFLYYFDILRINHMDQEPSLFEDKKSQLNTKHPKNDQKTSKKHQTPSNSQNQPLNFIKSLRSTKEGCTFLQQLQHQGLFVCSMKKQEKFCQKNLQPMFLVYQQNYTKSRYLPSSQAQRHYPCSWHYHNNKLEAYQFSDKKNKEIRYDIIQKLAKILSIYDTSKNFGITANPFAKISSKTSPRWHLSLLFIWIIFWLSLYSGSKKSETKNHYTWLNLCLQPIQQIFVPPCRLQFQRNNIQNAWKTLSLCQNYQSFLIPPSISPRPQQNQTKPLQLQSNITAILQDNLDDFANNLKGMMLMLPLQIKNSTYVKQFKENITKNVIETIQENTTVTAKQKENQQTLIITNSPIDLEQTNRDIEHICNELGLGKAVLKPFPQQSEENTNQQTDYTLSIQANQTKILKEIETSLIQNNDKEALDVFYIRFSQNNSTSQTVEDILTTQQYVVEVAIVMDTTFSMCSYFDVAKRQVQTLIDKCVSSISNKIKFKLAFVTYTDYIYQDYIKSIDLTDDKEQMRLGLRQMKCETYGNRDVPEAMIEGIQAATQLYWSAKNQSFKYIVVISDAPPHGRRFVYPQLDNYPDKNQGDLPVAQTLKANNIKLSIINAGGSLYNTIPEFQKIFGQLYFHSNSSQPSQIIQSIYRKLISVIQPIVLKGQKLQKLFQKRKTELNSVIADQIQQHLRKLKQQEAKDMTQQYLQQVTNRVQELVRETIQQLSMIQKGPNTLYDQEIKRVSLDFFRTLTNSMKKA